MQLEDIRQEAAPSGQPDVNIEDSRIENLNNSPTQLGMVFSLS